MEEVVQLLVILVVARLFGEAAERLGQSAAVGGLVAGLILAAAVRLIGTDIPEVKVFPDSDAIHAVAQLGIFFVVLVAGIEMKPREIAEHGATSLAVALGGVAVPLAAGFAIGWHYLPETELRLAQSLLVGVAMSITAIPVTVRVFEEMNLLHTRVGETVVAAAIFDDIAGLFLLAVLTALTVTGDVPDPAELALLLGKIVLFFAVTVGLGVHVYPQISKRARHLQAAASEFGILMVVALAYAVLAELLGMHWIMGVFLAGLFFEPARVGDQAYDDMLLLAGGIAGGFLAPVFFASIGLRVDIDVFQAVPLFLFLVIATAILGKLIGAGIPALLVGMSGREAAATGIGMSARGAVELVVLGVAHDSGLFRAHPGDTVVSHLYSALVMMAVVTTLLAPPALRAILRHGDETPPST